MRRGTGRPFILTVTVSTCARAALRPMSGGDGGGRGGGGNLPAPSLRASQTALRAPPTIR